MCIKGLSGAVKPFGSNEKILESARENMHADCHFKDNCFGNMLLSA